MLKNKKIIIGIIILVIAIIAIIVFIPKGKKYKNTIFLGSVAKVKVVDNSIKVSYEDVKIRKQKAKIIYENDVVDGYIVSKEEPSSDQENTINAYNKDKEFLFCEPTLLAFTSDLDVNYIKIDYQFYDDINTVYNYIYKENIDLATTKLDYFVKSTFDFDKDGVQEYIYSMGLIRSESRYDSLVVMFKDNKYYIINEKIGTYSEDSTRLELIGIMDINNDGNYEFIISKIDGEYSNIYYDIYNFKGSSFNKISID